MKQRAKCFRKKPISKGGEAIFDDHSLVNRNLTSFFTDLTVVASITTVVDWILIYLFISVLNMLPGVASQPVLVFSGFLLIVAGFAGMGSGRWSAADASRTPQ